MKQKMIIIDCPKCRNTGKVKKVAAGCYGSILIDVACKTCNELGKVKISEDKLKEIK